MAKRLASAAANGDINMVTRLVEAGEDVNSQGADGMTSLAISSFWGYSDIVNCLLRNGADVNAINKGTNWTALHCAAFQGHGPVVLSLLRARSNPKAVDNQGRTPADFASAIDAIWPLFSAAGCTRTPKSELLQKRIIMKEKNGKPTGATASRGGRYEPNSYLNRPGSSYVLDTRNIHNSTSQTSNSQSYHAAMSGDVLANEHVDNQNSMSTGRWQMS